MSFEGKVIIVTGASSGIGADCAKHLAKLNGKVALVGRNEQRLNKVADEITEAGSPTPLKIVADVTKDAQHIIDDTIKHFGKLDILVNNAGIASPDNISDFKVNEMERIFNTNVSAVAILTSLAVPHLEKTKGNVVNVSSIAGLKPLENLLSYCVTKAALNQLTKCCALELASKGIRVNAINPSVIRTPIFELFGIAPENAELAMDVLKLRSPLERIGEVSDTSSAIAYLASDAASFLTGILLPIDGGSVIA